MGHTVEYENGEDFVFELRQRRFISLLDKIDI